MNTSCNLCKYNNASEYYDICSYYGADDNCPAFTPDEERNKTMNNCLNCKHYSEEFMSEENRYENHCSHYEDYCFIPRTNCPHFTLNIIRIPCLRAPKFDIKRSLIHQAYINNPDMTVQQFADTISQLHLPNLRIR